MPGPATRARAKGATAAAARGGTVLVTVGTTRFDALVAAVDDPAVAEALAARGYAELVLQARRKPCTLSTSCPSPATYAHVRIRS
jgi:UDP-N-acetylglucosamine transferase subunit ALG13